MISIIVAIAENYAIGKNNDLLWHIPEDMKRFKKITRGHKIIMGKRTYQSLPYRPLKDRTNIVISDVPGDHYPGHIRNNNICPVLQGPVGQGFVGPFSHYSMPAGDLFKPFQVLRYMPEKIIVFPDGVIFCYGYNDGYHTQMNISIRRIFHP